MNNGASIGFLVPTLEIVETVAPGTYAPNAFGRMSLKVGRLVRHAGLRDTSAVLDAVERRIRSEMGL